MTSVVRNTILVLNAGSSSLKAALFDARETEAPFLTAQIERIGAKAMARAKLDNAPMDLPPLPQEMGASHEGVVAWLLPVLGEAAACTIIAAGHRVVHGGPDITTSVLVTDSVLAQLEALIPLARTHQPHNLAAIRAVAALWPDLPQVACFDTAFHATIPEAARLYALPKSVRDKGVRRYGFHGQSYQWIAQKMAPKGHRRVVACHLGNGASLCGMIDGESRATTMGFTPLDGLIMGERPGLTDPGILLFMLEEMCLSTEEVRTILFKESGLKGLSGLSNDMRVLEASEAPDAQRALDVYVHRLKREIGAITAEIGGIDALVFTAGIGENAANIRDRVVAGLRWLGNGLKVYVIPTNEEAVIAAATLSVLGAGIDKRQTAK